MPTYPIQIKTQNPIVIILLYGTLFTPQLHPPSSAEPLTVMTFNVRLGNEDVVALVKAIRSADANIVGIQEITPELARALEEKLITDYPHSTLTMPQMQSDSPGANTVGLLSRRQSFSTAASVKIVDMSA